MHIACLDTESTSTGKFNEILELAIYSARGELILNSLYKPKRNRRWPHSERVHGISPVTPDCSRIRISLSSAKPSTIWLLSKIFWIFRRQS